MASRELRREVVIVREQTAESRPAHDLAGGVGVLGIRFDGHIANALVSVGCTSSSGSQSALPWLNSNSHD